METMTLQDLVIAVAAADRDYLPGTTGTAGGSTASGKAMYATGRSVDSVNDFVSSQVLFLQPAAGVAGLTGNNPKKIMATTTGALPYFTLDETFNGTTGVPSDVSYALINIEGKGNPYHLIVEALKMAVSALHPQVDVSGHTLTITTTSGFADREYTVPAGFDWLTKVSLKSSWYTTARPKQLIPNRQWGVFPGTRTLWFAEEVMLLSGDTIYLEGKTDQTLPSSLTGTIVVEREEVVNAALEYLLRDSPDRMEAAFSAGLYADRQRTVPRYRQANAIKVG